MCAEYSVQLDLEDIKPWARDPGLLEINPAATGCILMRCRRRPGGRRLGCRLHAIEERYSPTAVAGLFPAQARDRAEMWRAASSRC